MVSVDNSHTTKRKVLVLGASPEIERFYELLLQENLQIICFDRHIGISPEIQANPNLTCYGIDFSDLEKVKEVISYEGIEFSITVPVGRALIFLGKLNDAFTFNGPSFRAIDTLTDKAALHQYLRSIGLNDHNYLTLPCTDLGCSVTTAANGHSAATTAPTQSSATAVAASGACSCISGSATGATAGSSDAFICLPQSLQQLHNNVEAIESKIGYPMIVKPCYGSGSLGAQLIRNRDALLAYTLPARFQNDPVLIEECIDTTEYLVNAFIDSNGVCHSLGIYKKQMTPEPYRQEIAYYSDDYTAAFQLIKPYMESVAKGLALSNSFMQADVFVSHDDKVYLVDCSPRLTGNSIIHMQLINGINPISIFRKCVVDGQPFEELPVQRPACMRFFNFENSSTYTRDESIREEDYIASLYTPDELAHIAMVQNNLKQGVLVGPMTSGTDCYRGYIIATGTSVEQADELTHRYVKSLI